MKTVGSRREVFNGNAKHTSGGLIKSQLKLNKGHDIVSKKNSARAKRTESSLMGAWRASVKKISALPKYEGKFNKLNKSGTFYKAVKAEYKKKLEKA